MDTIKPTHLEKFNQYSKNNGDTLVVRIKGARRYLELLRDILRANHTVNISPIWPDQYNDYDFGLFINHANEQLASQISTILSLFEQYLFLDDNLAQTFALDYHMQYQGGRTKIGELVYQAKYQNGTIDQLVKHFLEFIKHHPLYHQADYIYGVPSSRSPLVQQLVTHLGRDLDKPIAPILINKHPSNMKDLSLEEKFQQVGKIFETVRVDEQNLQGKHIILIDDIYQSGATMNEIAQRLQRYGATVYGLVATKTHSQSNV